MGPSPETGSQQEITRREFIQAALTAMATTAVAMSGVDQVLASPERREDFSELRNLLPVDIRSEDALVAAAVRSGIGEVGGKAFSLENFMAEVYETFFAEDPQALQELMQDLAAGISVSTAFLNRYLAIIRDDPEFEQKRAWVLAYGVIDFLSGHGEAVRGVMNIVAKTGRRSMSGKTMPLEDYLGGWGIEEWQNNQGRRVVSMFIRPDTREVFGVLRGTDAAVISCSWQHGEVGFQIIEMLNTEPAVREQYRDRQMKLLDEEGREVSIFDVRNGTYELGQLRVLIVPDGFSIAQSGDTGRLVLVSGDNAVLSGGDSVFEDACVPAEDVYEQVTEVTYGVEMFGAYGPESALKNLGELCQILQENFPEGDRIVVMAAGNWDDDMREAVAQLQAEGKWYAGLVLVAEWGDAGPFDGVYGATVYVDNARLMEELGEIFSDFDAAELEDSHIPHGSSFSTPVVSTALALIQEARPDWTMGECIGAMMQNCISEVIYETREGQREAAAVFNLRAFVEYHRSLTGRTMSRRQLFGFLNRT